ncbi:FUSC family protein [Clostridium massiliamazoniense]|uniref:FUSC family protein n=1 Tax=Clostridium massiliamazoniense TaxID=1347366 RepID=UPI0006D84979|nr:aromatic acid exporter family protein [Clostridium massiliamazoniense]
MEKISLPKIGARNLKTAFAVFLCIVIFRVFGSESPFFACIAAVICMQDSYENSIVAGKNRMIGTCIGGIAGVLETFILIKYDNPLFSAIVVSLLCIAVIYCCNIFKKPGAINIACIVLFANTVVVRDIPSYTYTITRIIETLIGIVIAVLINRYIFPYKKEDKYK